MLDTDVFSYYLKGDTRARDYDKHTKGKRWALSFVTVGELLTGAKKANWGETKRKELEKRIALAGVIPYDMELVRTYGEINGALLQTGRVIAANDLWIASTAIRHSIPLVSHNRKHYDDIPGLVLISETPRILKPQMEIGERGRAGG